MSTVEDELSMGEVSGRAIKIVRALRDISQRRLAERARIEPASRLSAIERGMIVPTPSELQRIWSALST